MTNTRDRINQTRTLIDTIDNRIHLAQRTWDHYTDTIRSPTPGGSTPAGTHSDPTATTATRRRPNQAQTTLDRHLNDALAALDRAAAVIDRTLRGDTTTGPCTVCGKGGAGQPLTTRTIGQTDRLICDACRRSWERRTWHPGEWITTRQGIRTATQSRR